MIKKGFTFLEVMISIVMFGIGAIVCLDNYLINIRNSKVIKETQLAILLAERKVEEFKLNPEESKEGKGIFPAPYDNYQWELSFTEKVLGETEKLECELAYLEIFWEDGNIKMLVPVVKSNNEKK